MRIFCIILFSILLGGKMYSQDTISFLNKTSLAVKVNEIGIQEVKYHRFDNADGPLYIANKNEIAYIKFANGQVDTIHAAAIPKPITANEGFNGYKPITAGNNSKIEINGKKLSYNGKAVGEARLFKIINMDPVPAKRSVLLKEYTTMKTYKKRQYLFGFVGLGAAVALTYAGAVASFVLEADELPFVIGFGSGVTIGVTGAIISGIFKHKRLKQKVEVAKLYNNP
ncbi:MAG: hypothetical protein V4677_06105 [Bacteroidota bacterium]